MLHRLWDHISNCYARAADARRRAEETANPERRADLLLLEENWTRLAQSYELSERLGRFLLDRSNAQISRMDWQRAAVAPFDRDLELATVGASGIQPIAFPCRRVLRGWIAADTRQPLDIQPTHWREWVSEAEPNRVKRPAGWQRSGSDPAPKASLLLLQSSE